MADRSFFLLAYDIADNARRARIAKLMESIGERVQGSVFEAWLTPTELQKIVTRSEKFMKMAEDSLRIYTICEACRPRLKTLGQGKPTPQPSVLII